MKKLAILIVLSLFCTGCAASRTVITVEPDPINPNRVNWKVAVIVPNTIETEPFSR